MTIPRWPPTWLSKFIKIALASCPCSLGSEKGRKHSEHRISVHLRNDPFLDFNTLFSILILVSMRKGVLDNSILCVECLRWVHKDVVAFQESWRVMLISIAGGAWRERMASFSQFCWKRLWSSPMWRSMECVPKFCYLGDTLGAGGGLEEAARARVRCA